MMKKVRKIVAYKHYFKEFFENQPDKVQAKIFKILEIIETYQRIPTTYLSHTRNGLYEARVKIGSNIWRVFCFFDEGKLVILLNGFQKKSQKTPEKELKKAMKLKEEYFKYKKNRYE